MMTPKQIASRITGFSTPVFGVSWQPSEAEIEIVQRVITFLEDRRVLYNDYEMEMPEHCVQSVVKIREFLTTELGSLPNKSGVPQHFRTMRAACRQFMDKVGPDQFNGARPDMFGGPDSWAFASALGELRCTFGNHLAILCVMHGLGMEGDLSRILPPEPSDDDA